MDHPITQKMMEVVKEHRDSNRNHLHGLAENGSYSELEVEIMKQLKHQILTFDEILDIKTYLIEAIEDEVQSTGTESPDKSQESI